LRCITALYYICIMEITKTTSRIDMKECYVVTLAGCQRHIKGDVFEYVRGHRVLDILDKYFECEPIPDTIADGSWHHVPGNDYVIKVEVQP
jgi:hypothetical protein